MKQSQQATNKKHYLTSFPSLYCHHSNRPQHAYSFQPPPCDHSCTTPESLDHNTATTAPEHVLLPRLDAPRLRPPEPTDPALMRQRQRRDVRGRAYRLSPRGPVRAPRLQGVRGSASQKMSWKCSIKLSSCLTSARLQLLWVLDGEGAWLLGKKL